MLVLWLTYSNKTRTVIETHAQERSEHSVVYFCVFTDALLCVVAEPLH